MLNRSEGPGTQCSPTLQDNQWFVAHAVAEEGLGVTTAHCAPFYGPQIADCATARRSETMEVGKRQ